MGGVFTRLAHCVQIKMNNMDEIYFHWRSMPRHAAAASALRRFDVFVLRLLRPPGCRKPEVNLAAAVFPAPQRPDDFDYCSSF
jgi:hypothetical protein